MIGDRGGDGRRPHPGALVGVDLGGTTIKAARVDARGEVQERVVVATPAAGGEAVLAAVCRAVDAVLVPSVIAVAVSSPGVVDVTAGVVRFAANLGLRDAPLVEVVRARCALAERVAVVLQHDVRGACEAELHLGRGAGAGDLLCVVLGTGLAAGVVVAGRLVTGGAGAAGELGHVPIVSGGEPCACGGRGCAEVYASAGGVARRYAAAGGRPGIDAASLVALLGRDPVADRVWADAVDVLARAVAGAVALTDPALVVLAGGLSRAGEVLRGPVADRLAQLLPWRAAPDVVLSRLAADAGLAGAALAAARASGTPTSAWTAQAWAAQSRTPGGR